jgi:G:T-mismatch repair DNA endonuclease (very short patch repair protein)
MDDRFYTNKMKNPVGKLFEDVKKYDKQKISDYMIKQYNIIIVWEYDYLNNKIELFKKLKEILYEKNNKCGSYWNSASFFNKC